jgi:hypothetical protein
MTLFDVLYTIAQWLQDARFHFLFSGVLGLWGFYRTLTMLCVSFWVLERLTHKRVNSGVVIGILICCLLAGVSCALAAHWALDYWQHLFNTPLYPPLQLQKPGV